MTDTPDKVFTRPFWEAAAQHRLVRPVCKKCGTNFFTPQIACPRCHSEDWSWEDSSGRGVIYSKSIVYKAPAPGFAVPYVLAIVALEEGWHMLTNIINCPPDQVQIGMRVRVTFQRPAGESSPPLFEPEARASV
jgi:uncharacterized protein